MTATAPWSFPPPNDPAAAQVLRECLEFELVSNLRLEQGPRQDGRPGTYGLRTLIGALPLVTVSAHTEAPPGPHEWQSDVVCRVAVRHIPPTLEGDARLRYICFKANGGVQVFDDAEGSTPASIEKTYDGWAFGILRMVETVVSALENLDHLAHAAHLRAARRDGQLNVLCAGMVRQRLGGA